MSEFTRQLAQMVAAARLPVVGGQAGPRFIGSVQERVRPGFLQGPGEEFGKGISDVLVKKAEWNLPQSVRQRALLAYELLSDPTKLTPQSRKRLLSYPTVQETLRQYHKVAPELFVQDESGMIDVIPLQESPEQRLTGAKAGYYQAGAQRVRQLLPYEEKEAKLDTDLKELERQVSEATTPEQIEAVRLKVKQMRENLASARQQREQQAEAFPLEQQVRQARVAATQAAAEESKARAGLVSEQAVTEREARPFDLNILKQREALLRKQQEHLDAQIDALTAEAQAKEDRQQWEEYKQLFQARREQDKALRDKYMFTAQFDPTSYALEDSMSTSAMVDGMGLVAIPVAKDPSGRVLTARVSAALTSPTAQFWVNKSLSELYNAFLTELPNGQVDKLKGIAQAFQDLWMKTYGHYSPEVAANAPQLKPDAYDDMANIWKYMALKLDEVLPPDDPSKLDPALREKYERDVGGRTPIPPGFIPVEGGGPLQWLKSFGSRFFRE